MSYETLRQRSLRDVLGSLGISTNWKARKDNTEFFGQCPFHEGRNQTSFSFDNQGRFYCFSCKKKGKGAIDLVKLVKGWGFQEAVEWLTTNQPSNHPNTQSRQCKPVEPQLLPKQEPQENPAYKSSYEKFKVESEWLNAKGFSKETLETFGVFQYQNPKRRSNYNGQIFFPIQRFRDGEVVGYQVLLHQAEGREEWIWPKGVLSSLEVFGSCQQKRQQLPHRVGYLLDSPLAVMHFHQLGLPAVSCYQSSVYVHQQVEILRQLAKGWMCLGDKLGDKLLSLAQHTWVKCPASPNPETMTREQVLAL